MNTRALVVSLCVLVITALMPAGAVGQSTARTPWGDPNLQGTYTNKTITPLERPEDLGAKEFLTDEEVAAHEQARLARNERLLHAPPRRTVVGGNVGAYKTISGSMAARGQPAARR